MLTVEQNDRITRVGPGTPLGEMMRRYWHPVAPVAMLDENPVKKVRILGEDLILYRDRSGSLGLVGRRCAHRLVDMAFGIPESHGLRCPYHGWCYDETGQCIETPLESPNSRLKEQINIGGYPVQEMGGLVFAYLGPAPAPVLPPWDFLVQDNAIRQIGVTIIPCNWLQCHENSGDPYHNVYLHGHFFKYALERKGLLESRASDASTHRATSSMRFADHADHVVFDHDPYGFRKGILYTKERGAAEDRIGWHAYNIFPYYSRSAGGIRTQVNIRVPMDDERTYHLNYTVFHAPGVEAPAQPSVPYYWAPIFDESGEPILDYVLAQDMAAWWSQGSITDRSKEHLGMTDLAIIQQREIIEREIQSVEAGQDPMNVFRDPAVLGKRIDLEPAMGSSIGHEEPQPGEDKNPHRELGVLGTYREKYHLGYYQDDADRYGPATPLAAELIRAHAELAKVPS